MAGNPVIAAWIAGGLIWSAALVGLGAMSGTAAIDQPGGLAYRTPVISAEETAAAYERALDGDAPLASEPDEVLDSHTFWPGEMFRKTPCALAALESAWVDLAAKQANESLSVWLGRAPRG